MGPCIDSVDIFQDLPCGFIFPPIKPKASAKPDSYECDETKLEEVQQYAASLKKKFPSMKPARIARKTAEHFNLKKAATAVLSN